MDTEVQGERPLEGHPHQLVYRFLGILLSSTGRPVGLWKVLRGQFKTIQEIITLVIFSVFSVLYLKEDFRWNTLVGFLFIIAAAFFIFKKWQRAVGLLR